MITYTHPVARLLLGNCEQTHTYICMYVQRGANLVPAWV